MALSVVRKGVISLTGRAGRSLVAPAAVIQPQIATIVSKALRGRDYKRPAPYPYKDNSYGLLQAFLDKTTHRMDENSKIIVVDGPIAAGKTKFAQELAEELDMHYIPQANMDMVYINSYGYDLRQLDPLVPDTCKSFDEKDFLGNPNHRRVAAFQFDMLKLRLNQYLDALGHLLSTGQGVVMERSVYSDLVFAETLAHFGYLSKKALNLYYECRKMTVPLLMRPHLVVYLDVPVDVTLKRIQARGLPHEINSSVLSTEFLSQMEMKYKQQFLREMKNHAEILVYDWSEEGDTEVVVEDIERVNFEFGKNDPKMADWKLKDEWEWCEKRMQYTKYRSQFMMWLVVPDFDVEEMVIPAGDHKIYADVLLQAPGERYEVGFNRDMGDQFILTKVKKDLAL